MTQLNLYDNKLTSLPPEIGNLTNLTYLGLPHNKLGSLPPEIGRLTQLTNLPLYGNEYELTSLPLGIDRLRKEVFKYHFRLLYEESIIRNKVRRTIAALRVQDTWFKYWWVPNEEGVARKALKDYEEISELLS